MGVFFEIFFSILCSVFELERKGFVKREGIWKRNEDGFLGGGEMAFGFSDLRKQRISEAA